MNWPRRCCLLAAALATSAALAAAEPGQPAVMNWAQAFPLDAAPADVHFKARYRGADGAEHTLESWRVGQRFLHRRTDADLDLFATADDASAGHFHYRLVDHQRKAVIDVGRANLFRIGVFTEWSGLAHAISEPRAPVRIVTLGRDTGVDSQPCEWRLAAPAGASPGAVGTEICWSQAWALPLRIREHRAGTLEASDSFDVVQLERLSQPGQLAVPPDLPAGYDYIDADADIDPNGD